MEYKAVYFITSGNLYLSDINFSNGEIRASKEKENRMWFTKEQANLIAKILTDAGVKDIIINEDKDYLLEIEEFYLRGIYTSDMVAFYHNTFKGDITA